MQQTETRRPGPKPRADRWPVHLVLNERHREPLETLMDKRDESLSAVVREVIDTGLAALETKTR
jgi:hypothetical protein